MSEFYTIVSFEITIYLPSVLPKAADKLRLGLEEIGYSPQFPTDENEIVEFEK